MNTIVQSVLEANALPGLPRITHVSPVKLDTTALPGGSLVMLLFVDDAPEPRYVLRLPRTPEVPDRILTNYDALRALSSVPAVAPSVPSAVYCGVVDSVLASVETCVPGLPLAVRMRVARNEGNREELAHLFGLAARWVWQLHAAPLTPECSVYAHDMEACAYGAIGRLREAGLLTEPQSG
ncbi:MAG: hypothetical protein FJX72_18995, partial [Armatimonadetes bacterium]|nr:hypothetical protein [Armatimonadota bacterium]